MQVKTRSIAFSRRMPRHAEADSAARALSLATALPSPITRLAGGKHWPLWPTGLR
jgi:hypothetical protein